MSLTIQSGGSLTIQGGGGGGGGGATVGTYASRPAAGNAGALYIATDSPIAQWVDDGSAWRPLIQGQALGTQVPAASAFTLLNAQGTTLSDNKGALKLTTPVGADATMHAAVIPFSSATAYVVGQFAMDLQRENQAMSIGLWNSTTKNALTMDIYVGQASQQVGVVSSVWSDSSRVSYTSVAWISPSAPIMFRVHLNGNDVIASSSRDGQTWTVINQKTKAQVFGAGQDANAIGFGRWYNDGSFEYNSNILSLQYGSL